ncbi:MAG: hypothetical protein GF320_07330 [Armatimonadia bacterium]|nr:hypothetical protein [Armatimonadia bacterium]
MQRAILPILLTLAAATMVPAAPFRGPVATDDGELLGLVGAPDGTVHDWQAGDDPASLPERPWVILSPEALEGEGGRDALEALLTRPSTVVLPRGLSDAAAQALGFKLWHLPTGATELWAEGPWEGDDWRPRITSDIAGDIRSPGPPAELMEGAAYQPLLVAGRGRDAPLAVLGFGLRYVEGPRRGSALIILARGLEDPHPLTDASGIALARIAQWLGAPFVTDPWPDYSLIEPGEALRLPIRVVVPHDEDRDLHLAVVLRGADGVERERVDTIIPRRVRGEGFLDTLEAIARFEGRRWPRPYLVTEVRVFHGRERLATGRGAVVSWEPSVLLRAPRSSVTGRRMIVSESAAPLLGGQCDRPFHIPGGLPADRRDLLAWNDAFRRLADAGATVVRVESAMARASQPGEFERRLDGALLMLADAHGLALELEPAISSGRVLLLDQIENPRIAPSLLLTADTRSGLSALAELWPRDRLTPAPEPTAVPGSGAVALSTEGRARAGSQPVRVLARGGRLDLGTMLHVAALGLGGSMIACEDVGVAPETWEEMQAARLITALLQPAAHQPALAVVAPDPDASALARALSGMAVDWGVFTPATVDAIPLATHAILVEDAAALSEPARRLLEARAEGGDRVLAVGPAFSLQHARPTSFGHVSRTENGYLGWIDSSRPGAAEEAVVWLGVPWLVEPGTLPPEPVRVVASDCVNGSFVVVSVDSAERRTVTVRFGRHSVRLGVRRDRPGIVAMGPHGPWLVGSMGPVWVDGAPWLDVPPDAYILLASQLGEALPDARSFLGTAFYRGDQTLGIKPRVWERGEPGVTYRVVEYRNGALREMASRGADRGEGWMRVRLESRHSGLPFGLARSDDLPQVMLRVEALLR